MPYEERDGVCVFGLRGGIRSLGRDGLHPLVAAGIAVAVRGWVADEDTAGLNMRGMLGEEVFRLWQAPLNEERATPLAAWADLVPRREVLMPLLLEFVGHGVERCKDAVHQDAPA